MPRAAAGLATGRFLRMVEPLPASWFCGWFWASPLWNAPRKYPRTLALAARLARGGGQRAGSSDQEVADPPT